MNLLDAFKELLKNRSFNFCNIDTTIKALTKKLNNVYYDSDSETDHVIYGGSIGRKTAIDTSDVDYIYLLPYNLYNTYKNRKYNAPSSLLSDVRKKVKDRYPDTDIKGDGQVVDVKFKKIIVEIVPSFNYLYDQKIIYPDTHDNGTWKIASPKSQIHQSIDFNKKYPIYYNICKMIRCWKNSNNVKIDGISIDSTTKYFLENNHQYLGKTIDNIDIIQALKEYFYFLQTNSLNSIFMIGENELLKVNEKHIKKRAKRAELFLNEKNQSDLWDNCQTLFGKGFPNNPSDAGGNIKEEFIEQFYPVKIRNHVKIDCDIVADGFRPIKLSSLLKNWNYNFIVSKKRNLYFRIVECDVEKPYKIFWKVRNIGNEARARKDFRGEIIEGGPEHEEKSVFRGFHYIECYIVKDGNCVAKTRRNVPID